MSIAESEKQSWYLITKAYVRKIRLIRIIWAISILIVIGIQCVCFVNPYWVVSAKGPVAGYFGLWKYCRLFNGDFRCQGRADDYSTLLNPSAKAAMTLQGISVLVLVTTVFLMGLFVFFRGSKVLRICGWMLCLAGILSATVLVVFPSIWDDAAIKVICGPEAKGFKLGSCEPKWPFFLACINTLACLITAVLAFTMADRFVVVEDEYLYRTQVGPAPLSHGLVNAAFQVRPSQAQSTLILPYNDELVRSNSTPRQVGLRPEYLQRALQYQPSNVVRTSYAPSSVYA